jgi:hypothetical protein
MKGKEPKVSIFMRGSRNKGTTLKLSELAWERVAELAHNADMTVPEVICDMIEDYLVWLAENGHIDWPEGYDHKLRKWKR